MTLTSLRKNAQLERFTLYQVIHARKVLLITLGEKTSLSMYPNKLFNSALDEFLFTIVA